MRNCAMNASYELIDLISGNLFDAYERESDALDMLIEIDLAQGAEAVRRFALLREVDGDSGLIAMEDDLVRRVQQEKQNLICVERAGTAAVSSRNDAASGGNQTWWRIPFPFTHGFVGGVRTSGITLVPGGA